MCSNDNPLPALTAASVLIYLVCGLRYPIPLVLGRGVGAGGLGGLQPPNIQIGGQSPPIIDIQYYALTSK